MEVTDFTSWEMAGTVTGAATIVWILISALKGVLQGYWSTQIQRVTALVLSIGLMELVAYLNAVTWENYILAVVNGAIISLAVMQFDTVTATSVKAKYTAARSGKKDE